MSHVKPEPPVVFKIQGLTFEGRQRSLFLLCDVCCSVLVYPFHSIHSYIHIYMYTLFTYIPKTHAQNKEINIYIYICKVQARAFRLPTGAFGFSKSVSLRVSLQECPCKNVSLRVSCHKVRTMVSRSIFGSHWL